MNSRMKRANLTQGVHDATVEAITKILTECRYSVKADHIYWNDGAPQELYGFIPDIYAIKDNSTLIIEVETDDSLDNDHTLNQLLAFEKAAQKIGATSYLVLRINNLRIKEEECISKAKSIVQQHKLLNTIVASYNDELEKIITY